MTEAITGFQSRSFEPAAATIPHASEVIISGRGRLWQPDHA
jgi:hypothetical protein